MCATAGDIRIAITSLATIYRKVPFVSQRLIGKASNFSNDYKEAWALVYISS